MTLQKIPFNIASFDKVTRQSYAWVDKTHLIPLLESAARRCALLVRPRRFGKTFIQTLLRAYYDRSAAADFEHNFQGTYIAGAPTAERNALYVLLVNFASLNSGSRFQESLPVLWRCAFSTFERRYPGSVPAELTHFPPNAQCSVSDCLAKFFAALPNGIRGRLCLLIDDYDEGGRAIENRTEHAEENRAEWDAMLQAIRNATAAGDLHRVFVTASTADGAEYLDFATDISKDPAFNDIMGFTQRELPDLIRRTVDLKRCRTTEEYLCRQLAKTYKRFYFNSTTHESVLPPSVCLFYLNTWQRTQQPPEVPFESMNHIDNRHVVDTKLKNLFVLGPINFTQNCPPLR